MFSLFGDLHLLLLLGLGFLGLLVLVALLLVVVLHELPGHLDGVELVVVALALLLELPPPLALLRAEQLQVLLVAARLGGAAGADVRALTRDPGIKGWNMLTIWN